MSEPEEAMASGWELRREGAKEWKPATVPGCWERDGIPGAVFGPVWYRKALLPSPPPQNQGRREFIEFDAVSYHCEGFADGKKLGEHTGMWDGFAWELPVGAKELTLKVSRMGLWVGQCLLSVSSNSWRVSRCNSAFARLSEEVHES